MGRPSLARRRARGAAPELSRGPHELELTRGTAPERPSVKNLPSFTFTIRPNRFNQFEKVYCGDLFEPLTGMAAGTYDGQAHTADVHGAEGPWGWVRFAPLGFTLQP